MVVLPIANCKMSLKISRKAPLRDERYLPSRDYAFDDHAKDSCLPTS